MAFEIVNLNELPRQHPLQINEIPGPKGAYEMKKIENGYYLRVDMPGVIPFDLKVIRIKEEKEIRFQGYAKRIEDFLTFKDASRFYVVIVKVECQDFDQVVVEHEIINGTCRILITRVHHASLIFRTSSNKKTDEGPSSSSTKSSGTHSHPYKVRIDGINLLNRHNDDCTCCHGEKGTKYLTGPLKEEDGLIYGYIAPEGVGAFETKFAEAGDGTGDYYMFFRLDMPDCCVDLKTRDCKYTIIEHRVAIEWHTDTFEFHNKFKLDSNGGRRKFCCQIVLPCGLNCCTFYRGNTGSSSGLVDGVFRAYIRINKNNIYKEDPSLPSERLQSLELNEEDPSVPSERLESLELKEDPSLPSEEVQLLELERRFADPCDDSAECSTSASVPQTPLGGGRGGSSRSRGARR